MAVRCEGDCRVMEQLGEKQDFESELSRLGYAHESFMMFVRRGQAQGSSASWVASYAVCVTNTVTKRSNIYWGGPGKPWIGEFAADVASGLYGPPDLSRHAGSAPRLRLVAAGPPAA